MKLRRIISVLAFPGFAFMAWEASNIVWPVDRFIAVITALAFAVVALTALSLAFSDSD